MQKGVCIHSRVEGMKHLCALGFDPDGMAKAACNPGEDYEFGLAYRRPCHSKEWEEDLLTRHGRRGDEKLRRIIAQKAVCDRFTEPTNEQVAEAEKERKASIERFKKVLPLISEIKDGSQKSGHGVSICPVCGGSLVWRLNVFGNPKRPKKHLWGRCETPGCVNWIE